MHSQFNKNKLIYLLLTICNFTFLAYYLILGYYNQPALDDYCVIAMQKDWGFNSPISYWYFHWNGRFLPLYLCNIFLSLYEYSGTTIWFTLFLIIGYIFAIYRILLLLLTKNIAHESVSKWEILNIAAFIFNVFVYNNFKFNTFFWLNASTMYFGGILFLLIGFGEIISEKKPWYSYLLIIFSFVYAGCSTENHALVMVFGMFGVIFISIFLKKYIKINLTKKYLIGAFSLLVSFILLIFAPGSQDRIKTDSAHMISTSKIDLLLSFANNFVIKYLLLIGEIGLTYLPLILLLAPIFIYFVYHQLFAKNNKFNNVKPVFWPFLVGTILLIGAAIAPTIYIFGNLGPQRVLTIVNALLIIFFIICTLFYVFKKQSALNIKQLINISCLAFIILIAQIIYRISNELPTLKAYAAFEKEKRIKLTKGENNGKAIEFKNFPTFETSNLTEKIGLNLLENFAPNQLVHWKNIIKHEPILPNIVEPSEITTYESCIGMSFGKSIKILPAKETN